MKPTVLLLILSLYARATFAQGNCLDILKNSFVSKDQNYAELIIDQRERAPYFSLEDQAKHKIRVTNGLVYDYTGNPVHTFGYAKIFIMDENLDIFIIQDKFLLPDQKKMRTHHSHLARGKKITAAGQIKITNGLIEYIDNQSGHYNPSLPFLTQFKKRLQSLNANLSNARFHSYLEGPIEPNHSFVETDFIKIRNENELNKIMSLLVIPIKERTSEQLTYLENADKNLQIDAIQTLIDYGIKFFLE